MALILDAMSATNMGTVSWTVHTRYLLWQLKQLTTNVTGVTMPDQAQDTP